MLHPGPLLTVQALFGLEIRYRIAPQCKGPRVESQIATADFDRLLSVRGEDAVICRRGVRGAV